MLTPVRGWTSKIGSRLGLEVTATPLRRFLRGLGESQAAQVVRSLGRLTARRKKCAFVGLQELNPGADIARISDVTVKAKLRAQERGAQLRDQFFSRIIARPEPILQMSINARLVCRPMRQFVECHVIKVISALEGGEIGHRDKISARATKRFTMA